MRRALPWIVFIAACGAEKRDVVPSTEGGEEAPAADGSEGEGEAPDPGPDPDPGGGEGEGEAPGDPGGPIDPDPNEYVGCPQGQRSDHNGCLSLPGGKTSDECAAQARVAITGAFAVEDPDALAPWGPVPGRASAEQRIVVFEGEVTALRPGHVEITEADGGEGRVMRLDPAAAEGQVVPTAVGEEVEVEFREYRETILSPSGRQELRTDHYFLLRIALRPDADAGERYGRLVYAIGDPLMPPRRERNLENLGITMQQNDEQPCAFVDISDSLTPVGLCRIYRRAAAYKFGEPGRSAVVLGGQSGEFQEDGHVFGVDSGDTHDVEDSHEDCNVPPMSEIRLTYLRPAQ